MCFNRLRAGLALMRPHSTNRPSSPICLPSSFCLSPSTISLARTHENDAIVRCYLSLSAKLISAVQPSQLKPLDKRSSQPLTATVLTSPTVQFNPSHVPVLVPLGPPVPFHPSLTLAVLQSDRHVIPLCSTVKAARHANRFRFTLVRLSVRPDTEDSVGIFRD
jgi:hypothetical protein